MRNNRALRNSISGGLPAAVPADGWYQVDLEGRWEGHPAGAYRLTPADIRGIVEYFNESCRANGVEIPVDYEHQGVVARLLGKSAESAGWIDRLEARENGSQLWAHIRWVGDARTLIAQGKFRYLSSHLVKDYRDPASGRAVPWALDSVALTNRPFKKELPPIANCDAAIAGLEDSAVAGEEPSRLRRASEGQEEAMENLLALLAAAMSLEEKAVANSLGVAEDAQADAILQAVAKRLTAGDGAARQLKMFAQALGVAETADEPAIRAALKNEANRADRTDPSDSGVKLLAICNALGATPEEPLAELLALIGSARALPALSAAERLVESAISVERKITPANREAFIRLATQDFEQAKRILNSMPPVLALQTSGTAAAAEAICATPEDEWAIQQHGLKREDYLKTKKELSAVGG
jgi:phage I-like protein